MSLTQPNYSCLENIIALQDGCDTIVPSSGLYAKSIGISRDLIEQIMTSEYSSELEFFNDRKKMAIEEIATAVHNFMRPKYKTVSISSNFRSGFVNENKVPIVGGGIKGILYENCNSVSSLSKFISELSLFTDYSGNIDVNVYDLYQGKIIDTIPVQSIAGQIVKVYPAKRYYSSQQEAALFFGYDSTGINSYKTTTKKGCANCGGKNYIETPYNTIQGGSFAISADPIRSNFISSEETGGMSIVHALECDHLQWLCGISGALALPILYKTGAKVLEYGLDESINTRFNNVTVLNKAAASERLAKYEFKWREELDNVLSTLRVPSDDRCFTCNETFQYRSQVR